MSKEIGKLIELLCEYEDVYNWFATLTIRGEKSERELKSDYMLDEDQKIIQIYIISKSYGFIKWLVENEKIDYEKVRSGEGNGSRWHFETVQPEYYILMLLSIQDEPINFLISILK